MLRADASGYAVGASLEQMVDEVRMSTPEDVQQTKTVPVAFLSRKLTSSQRNWVPREQETYAIVDMDWSAASPCLNRSSGLGALG